MRPGRGTLPWKGRGAAWPLPQAGRATDHLVPQRLEA